MLYVFIGNGGDGVVVLIVTNERIEETDEQISILIDSEEFLEAVIGIRINKSVFHNVN